jgi:hypothetical protein
MSVANKKSHNAFGCASPPQHEIHDERQKTLTGVSEPQHNTDEHLWTEKEAT